ERAHAFAAGGGGENRFGAAHALKSGGGVVHGGVDVDVGAQIFSELFLVSATADGYGAKSHLAGELDAEMSQAANALDRDEISAAQAGVANGVVGGDARAEERGGFRGAELIGDRRNAAGFGDHDFGIAAVDGDAGYDGVQTIHNVAAAAWLAGTVFAAEEADADALTDFPF